MPNTTRSWKKTSRHILLSGVAPALTGVFIVVLALNYVKIIPWDTVLVTVGSVLLGVGVFDVIFRLVAFEHFIERLSSTVLRALKLPILAFYESRSHLEPVEHELADVAEIWAAWYIGPYRDFEAFFPKGRRGRILLTSPYSASLVELVKVRKGDVATMSGIIKSITRHAMEKGIETRWFDGPVCNNVIIADPQKDRSWMRVEMLVPHQSPRTRPSFLLEKGTNKRLYDTFALAYEKMWQASRLPELDSDDADADSHPQPFRQDLALFAREDLG